MMSHVRIWSPFVIAYVGGTVGLTNETSLGQYLDVYNPLFGYAAVELYAGLLIGFVAALASRTWRGLLTLVLGLLAAGATLEIVYGGGLDFGNVVLSAFYFGFWLGFLGVPTYVIVTGIASVLRWLYGKRVG
jgi:hypothetical protein